MRTIAGFISDLVTIFRQTPSYPSLRSVRQALSFAARCIAHVIHGAFCWRAWVQPSEVQKTICRLIKYPSYIKPQQTIINILCGNTNTSSLKMRFQLEMWRSQFHKPPPRSYQKNSGLETLRRYTAVGLPHTPGSTRSLGMFSENRRLVTSPCCFHRCGLTPPNWPHSIDIWFNTMVLVGM